MDKFEGITEFVAVAESQGFSAAARRLGVSTAHVSRRIAALEQSLGIALFVRTTRQVRLTDAGETYYRHCSGLVDGLEEANEAVSNETISLTGTLRISAAGKFVSEFVAPLLTEFAQMHPNLSIDLDFSARVANFVEEGLDLAIRYGRLQDSSLIARKLVNRRIVAAASPDYLAKHGVPEHPQDLRQHNCLITNNDLWLFDTRDGPMNVRVRGRWRSNDADSLTHACLAGLGIAYMPSTSYRGAIEDGRLIPVLEPYWTKGIGTWLLYANRRHMPARVRLAVQFLTDKFQNWAE
ncbi:MAG: LysR family transcriptional regulator [Kordiimonadaceae bacterium]|nr:LysR family transcriptional regulator [Kordiimonadaceae bacterium]MBO6570110.1 LysR family transcriptional regulator [Kordiimonadaceae bacterium]MBO6965792.1 LysR family transcriptional regulator [Kordiimonadaceae bacterium]